MLLVNKFGVVHDTPDELGNELLSQEQGFRRATPDEEQAYKIQVAKSSPRYLARMNARREELEKAKNAEMDTLIDAEIAKEHAAIDSEVANAQQTLGGAPQPTVGQAPPEDAALHPSNAIPYVNPDDLPIADSDVKPLTTEQDVQASARTVDTEDQTNTDVTTGTSNSSRRRRG